MRILGWFALCLLVSCSTVQNHIVSPSIRSLDDLAIDALRARSYGSRIKIERQSAPDENEPSIVSYSSDGLRVYSRVDIPALPVPKEGFPVVVFVHGWIGIERAPTSDFYIGGEGNYQDMIASYTEGGFVVFTPGWRGHGTVNGKSADGIEFMEAWDNGSYISPVFYAIDVINLLDSLPTFDGSDLNLENVNLVAHSQGGDVALIALAIAGEGSGVATEISAASIWSGCFPSRFTQLETYEAMQRSPESFLSGDGSWNGTPIGAAGQVNSNFVFGYPADWIGTPNIQEWTWQKDTFSLPTVADALKKKLDEMYGAINRHVDDIDDAKYELRPNPAGRPEVIHDERVRRAMARIDAFYFEKYLTEPLALQHSDRDFYSLPEWNADLCARVNKAGGRCHDFEYKGNTHSLRISENSWFSGEFSSPGFSEAIQRDVALFNREDPSQIGTANN